MDLQGYKALYARREALAATINKLESDDDAASRKTSMKRLNDRITRSDDTTRKLSDEVAQLQQRLTACEALLRTEAEQREAWQSELDRLTKPEREQGNLDSLKREHQSIQETIMVSKCLY
jgi:DNA repair ATPase RecN